MFVSEISDLESTIGKHVRVTREFADVPTGSTGRIVEFYNIGKNHPGITVEWDNIPLAAWTKRNLRDGFGRDPDFDETQWLEVLEDTVAGVEV